MLLLQGKSHILAIVFCILQSNRYHSATITVTQQQCENGHPAHQGRTGVFRVSIMTEMNLEIFKINKKDTKMDSQHSVVIHFV